MLSRASSLLSLSNTDPGTSVLQKVNAKLGGINHCFDKNANTLEILTKTPSMVVGIDVSHPDSRSVTKAPSVVAIVASRDRTFTQWLGQLGFRRAESRWFNR